MGTDFIAANESHREYGMIIRTVQNKLFKSNSSHAYYDHSGVDNPRGQQIANKPGKVAVARMVPLFETNCLHLPQNVHIQALVSFRKQRKLVNLNPVLCNPSKGFSSETFIHSREIEFRLVGIERFEDILLRPITATPVKFY
jgi:hypothetical protein